MKLFVFTDFHENPQFLDRAKRVITQEGAAIAVCVGDFTIFGRNTRKMLDALDHLGVPTVLIHGNHEDEEEILTILPTCKNITWAHDRAVTVNGITFIGFGGHGFSQREPELEQLEHKLANQFDERTIILCHAPPYGTHVDEIENGWHVGNESLTMLIRRRKPMLVLCGHIHETFHVHDSIAGTPIINPGPDGEIIEIDD